MDIREFGKIIEAEVREELGSGYVVKYREIKKNNDVIRHAMEMRKADERVSPVVYIDNLFEEYKKGAGIMTLVHRLISLFERFVPQTPMDVSFYDDFSKVSHQLTFKLVSMHENESLLKNVPYRQYEDLAMIPLCAVRNDQIGSGTVTILNSHLKYWEISPKELWENIFESAPVIAPAEIKTMLETLEHQKQIYGACEEIEDIFVVSNKDYCNGAGVIFYPGVLKGLSERLKSDIYIIPSSIHEMIVMRAQAGNIGLDSLYHMVRQVNSTVISREEFLSNNIYLYERGTGKLKIAEESSIA